MMGFGISSFEPSITVTRISYHYQVFTMIVHGTVNPSQMQICLYMQLFAKG
jgi:hypothetical protein